MAEALKWFLLQLISLFIIHGVRIIVQNNFTGWKRPQVPGCTSFWMEQDGQECSKDQSPVPGWRSTWRRSQNIRGGEMWTGWHRVGIWFVVPSLCLFIGANTPCVTWTLSGGTSDLDPKRYRPLTNQNREYSFALPVSWKKVGDNSKSVNNS